MEGFKRTNENYFFLGGFLESDVDAIGDLINQNHIVHVSKRSPLIHILYDLNIKLASYSETYDFNFDKVSLRLNQHMIDNFYEHIESKYIVDKNKFWAGNIYPLTYYFNADVKAIVVYRDIPEVLYLMQKQNNKSIDECWQELEDLYFSFKENFEIYKDNIYLLNINKLKNNFEAEIDLLYKFLVTPSKTYHNLDKINIEEVDSKLLDDEALKYSSFNI